ncbi:hypothetical protein JAAARDRAFT_63400 [Jaapia argillacea MUCL 33604]|uniref:Mid2 domain-containing protein n=1 Tax=Jaapia argillacea MUCL 33604 TaxID=933084 RepID=A0A067P5G6_9AGAM|nr:hypothetical protein JAAARDRAFT_63400 [Jaapia argillacea MUCL 33604]
MSQLLWSLTLALTTIFLSLSAVLAGNTTCASNQLDWYTSVVGETPCMTYQRLRQICNPQYQVPSFRPLTPGDNCDDQLKDCCCNSIAWALSMLCMNCQQDLPGGSPSGIDAGVTAYALYRTQTDGSFCSPNTNQSLPTNIQAAVCNENIKLDNFLYSLFWTDGSCVYTEDTGNSDHIANNNNTFTHCPNEIVSSTHPPTSNSTSTSAPSRTSSSPPTLGASSSASQSPVPPSNTGPIVGGVVGGLVGLIALISVGVLVWYRRRRRRGIGEIDLSQEYTSPTTHDASGFYGQMTVTPFTLPASAATSTSHIPPKGPSVLSQGGHQYTTSYSNNSLYPSIPGHSSSHSSGSLLSSPAPTTEAAERHEDGGPVPQLARSNSGRLPPAYQPAWDAAQQPGSSRPPFKTRNP